MLYQPHQEDAGPPCVCWSTVVQMERPEELLHSGPEHPEWSRSEKRKSGCPRRKGAGTQMTTEDTANFWASSVNVFERSHLHLMCYIFLEDMRLFSLS